MKIKGFFSMGLATIIIVAMIMVVMMVGTTNATADQGEWYEALDEIFSMASYANPASNNEACVNSIRDLMKRQEIPLATAELRMLNDVQLHKLAILASVAGISRWTRDKDNVTKFLIAENGHLLHPYSPGAVESDVMLCIICVLLTVIATFHLIPPTATANK